MKEYQGAVFFVDILGVGALTQGHIKIKDEDFLAHNIDNTISKSEHVFCAKLLMKFRRILNNVMQNNNVNVAQLSDCAFIWSDNPDLVLDSAREIMWKTTSRGILCRGGIAYGEIVEPDSVNIKLGEFICGKAVTKAVKLEGTGKGARVFVDDEISCRTSSHIQVQAEAFRQSINPLDFSFVDEFMWALYPHKLTITPAINSQDSKERLKKILALISLLRFSPKYRWNACSGEGRLQIASTIDAISSITTKLQNKFDYKLNCNAIIDGLDTRDYQKYIKLKSKYLKEISSI